MIRLGTVIACGMVFYSGGILKDWQMATFWMVMCVAFQIVNRK